MDTSPGVNCGQYPGVPGGGPSPSGDNTDDVREQIAAGKIMVIQIAPSVRITLAESPATGRAR